MKAFLYPVIALCFSFIVGIYIQYIFSLNCNLLLPAVLLFISSAYVIKNQNLKTLCVLCCFIALGATHKNIHQHLGYKNHFLRITEKDTLSVMKLNITEVLRSSKYYNRFYGEICAKNNQKTFGKILVYQDIKDSTKLSIGTKITTIAETAQIRRPNNPNQFSYSQYLGNKNMSSSVKLQGENYRVTGQIKNIKFHLDQIRTVLISSFDKQNYNRWTMDFIKAFLFGQRQEMDRDLRNEFTRAGVIHILAISGLHTAIIYQSAQLVMRPLKKRYLRSKSVVILSLAILIVFAGICNFQNAVTRAALMLTILTISEYYFKKVDILNTLFTAAFIILLWDPNQLLDVGFQLSFLAVLALVNQERTPSKDKKITTAVLKYFSNLNKASWTVQIFLLPLLLFYFHQFPTLFFIANIIIIPLATLVLQMLLLTLISNFTFDWLSHIFGQISKHGIQLIIDTIQAINKIPWSTITEIPFTDNMTYITLGTVFVFIIWKGKQLKIIAVLMAILISATTAHEIDNVNNKEEFKIAHHGLNQLVYIKNRANKIQIHSSDTHIANQEIVSRYNTEDFHFPKEIGTMQPFYKFKDKNIVYLYEPSAMPNLDTIHYLVLGNNTSINLERLHKTNNIQQVVCDATNKKYYNDIMKKYCDKKKLPFHNVYEM
ncbi:MAG: ComEC/Rec2 family competence protein, partial [Flavobacterium sp.]|nr:ComEC/Rec2 family competence protein [Candidatus Neoflavobacterium equi]